MMTVDEAPDHAPAGLGFYAWWMPYPPKLPRHPTRPPPTACSRRLECSSEIFRSHLRSGGVVVWCHLRAVALRGAVLAGDPARPTLEEVEAVLQQRSLDRHAPIIALGSPTSPSLPARRPSLNTEPSTDLGRQLNPVSTAVVRHHEFCSTGLDVFDRSLKIRVIGK